MCNEFSQPLKKIQEQWALSNYTQEEAAVKLGITQSAVCQYLKGTIPLNLKITIKFANLFKIHPATLDTRLKF